MVPVALYATIMSISPDQARRAANNINFSLSLLDDDEDTTTSLPPSLADLDGTLFSRLTHVAHYPTFRPTTLACSGPILTDTGSVSASNGANSSNDSPSSTDVDPPPPSSSPASPLRRDGRRGSATKSTTITSNSSKLGLTSLAAIGGAQGIAILRMSQPQTPLLVLSHAASATSASHAADLNQHQQLMLSFCANDPRLLVSTSSSSSASSTTSHHVMQSAGQRRRSLLLWDVSGQTLSPLWGRIELNEEEDLVNSSASNDNKPDTNNWRGVTSLTWQSQPHENSADAPGGRPLLAATTAKCACFWDVRDPAAVVRPTLRFAVQSSSSRTANTISPYVQLACCNSQCGLLDAAGVMRIFDIRYLGQHERQVLSAFVGFDGAGVGLDCCRDGINGHPYWIGWGLDASGGNAAATVVSSASGAASEMFGATAEAIVKVWCASSEGVPSSIEPAEECTFQLNDGPVTTASFSHGQAYRLVANCAPTNLTCVRACPGPAKDCFVTVGFEDSKTSDDDDSEASCWRVDVWKLKDMDFDAQLDRLVSFRAGWKQDVNVRGVVSASSERFGRLCAAELILSTYENVHSESAKTLTNGVSICSLTDGGFLMSHTIPEVISQETPLSRKQIPDLAIPTSHVSDISPRIFPDVNDHIMADAARPWGGSSTAEQGNVRDIVPSGRTGKSFDASRGGQQNEEHGALPFEMDVPVAYSMPAMNIATMASSSINEMLPSKNGSVTGIVHDERGGAQAGTDITTSRVDADPERVPCPRLCGASFGPGVGGLALYSNGMVQKMWKWHFKADSSRLSSVPGLIGEAAPAGIGRTETYVSGLAAEVPTARNIPRTYQDLLDMTNASKVAQWGEQEQSEASSNAMNDADIFFEDSDASSSTSEEDNDTDANYLAYFGNSQHALTDPTESLQNAVREADRQDSASRRNEAQQGPSSDVLSPVVRATFEYDALALNNQSPSLAQFWKFFDIDGVTNDDYEEDTDENTIMLDGSETTRRHFEQKMLGNSLSIAEWSPTRQTLSKFRFLMPSPRSKPLQRVMSDPAINRLVRSSPPRNAPVPPAETAAANIEDEVGVHGGEYGMRPNVQESMVFLRKLFTHQKAGSKNQMQTMMSPPDSPMLPNNIVREALNAVRPSQTPKPLRVPVNDGVIDLNEIGVYTLRLDLVTASAFRRQAELEHIKSICKYNAVVARDVVALEKAQVWDMLVNVVERRLLSLESGSTGLDGWNGGALDASLVHNLMRYYESLGDVQMLATMVCVLRGRRRSTDTDDARRLRLLPHGQNAKFDTYVRKYADLLYGWGLLTRRAELNKHLFPTARPSSAAPATDGRDSPYALIVMAVTCPQCGKEVDGGASGNSNVCRDCQDFCVRCVICQDAVRGLFTFCEACGHGGHVTHLQSWFVKYSQCPSGCGCQCVMPGFGSSMAQMLDAPVLGVEE